MINISRLKDLSKDKINVIFKILSSQELCKAIKFNDNNFLDKPDIEDPSTLVYSHIFPFRKIPKKDDSEMKTYITIHFGGYRPTVGGYYKSGKIYIHVIVNMDCMSTDYDMIRTDFIVSEIDKLMNDERGIGIGKSKFAGMEDVLINESYVGTQICYEIAEFN